MGELAWVRSHVERCMQEMWSEACLETDEDGDYRFRSETGLGWIRVSAGDPIVVSVCIMAAAGLRSSLGLLKEVNDLNTRLRTAMVSLSHGHVIVEQSMTAEGLSHETFRQAVLAVTAVADEIGPMMASVYGGHTPFQQETSDVG